jgi:hypothetical protein
VLDRESFPFMSRLSREPSVRREQADWLTSLRSRRADLLTLFPLYGAWRFARDVEGDAVDAGDLVDDAVARAFE